MTTMQQIAKISAEARKMGLSYGEYVQRFAHRIKNMAPPRRVESRWPGRPVVKIDKSGNVLCWYGSIAVAATDNYCTSHYVISRCRGVPQRGNLDKPQFRYAREGEG